MKLPNAERAVVDREKIEEYVLNAAHPDNGGKAAFFLALGFRREKWQTLATAFLQMIEQFDMHGRIESAHGEKYILDGRIETPGGKTPMVRTVWIVDRGTETPRLVTAYPKEQTRGEYV